MGRIQAQILASDHAAPERGLPRAHDADRRIAGAFNAALLAIMGRRRLVVLVGSASERTDALVRLARHLDGDGALVLPAGGRADVVVEHLIRAAAHVTLPARQRPTGFDALIDHLADLLESMGTGVLLVDNADRLSAATLSDLVDLSGAQSDTGRFLQIVLAGSDALMRRLAEDARDLFSGIAVAVPLTPPAAPEPVAHTPAAAEPAMASGAAAPAPAAPAPRAAEPPSATAARGDAPQAGPAAILAATPPQPDRPRLQTPLPRMRPLAGKPLPVPGGAARRRTLWAASAGIAAMVLAVTLAAAPHWVSEAAGDATQSVADLIERFRSLRPADAAFTNVARTTPATIAPAPAPPAPAAPTSATPAPARIVDHAAQPSLPAPAAAPPRPKPPATEVAAAPAPPSLKQSPAAERPNLPVEALSMREPPPLDTSAALPDPEPGPAREPRPATTRTASASLPDTPMLREPPAVRDADASAGTSRAPGEPAPRDIVAARADGLRAALPPRAASIPPSGSTAPPAAETAVIFGGTPSSPATVTGLVAQARRQIDERHLTTPIGDNALETVRAMEAAAAAGIEPARLRAAIVDSYLRLGALAEQRGQYPLARVYYRRAQQAIPDHEKIGARLEAVESRLEEIRAEARDETRREGRQTDVPDALPSDAPKLQ